MHGRNPFDFYDARSGRAVRNERKPKKVDEVPEYFSLDEYTASLDPATLAERIDAESSLYRWCEVVLGYQDLPADCNYRLYEPIHRPMCERAERTLPIRGREKRKTQAKLLDLEPRGALKTNIITAGSLLYYLVHDYNGRGLIGSHNHKAAKEILSIIKWNMEFNEKFKKFYGDWAYFAKKYGKWRDELIELAFRGVATREPTIDTTGAEISKTGGHYEVIAIDDIQNRENVRSEGERENVRARFQEYFPQLEPNGGMLVPATRYHKLDVYGWLMERRAKALKNEAPPEFLFDIFVHSAWNEDRSLYYPTRLTEEFLAQQQIELEDYLFSVWYRNEPIEEGTKVFVNPQGKERDFDFIRDYVPYIRFPNGNSRSVYTTVAWDPAGRYTTSGKRSNRRDFHGLSAIGNDSLDVHWVLEAVEWKMPHDQLFENIGLFLIRNAAMKLSIETRGAGMQGLYVDLIKPVLKKMGLENVPIVEWSPGNTESKDTAIRGLQPRYRQGRMWFRKGYCEPLIRQMDEFPQGHDDVLDTLIQHKTISRPIQEDDVNPDAPNEGDFDLEEGTEGQDSFGAPSVGLGTPVYA